MRTALPSLAVALAVALPACNTGFAPQYRVDDVRVLAIRAGAQGSSSADVGVGDVLRLDALVANPLGRAGVTVRWYGCLPAPSEALPPCERPEFLEDPARLAAEAERPGSLVRALGACEPAPGGEGCGILFPLSSVTAELETALGFFLDVARANPAFRCRLYAELPVVAIAEGAGRAQLSLKSVRVVPSFSDVEGTELEAGWSLNLNPIAAEILRAGPDPSSCEAGFPVAGAPFPAGETVVCALAGSGSVGEYPSCDAQTPVTVPEDLEWQWYATGGEFPEFDGIGNATGSVVDFARPAGSFRIWAILRDNRGGTDWVRRDVGAAP
jgi:hypothetical protein